ncbi:ABC transporter permease [Loigolactobacillus backii]|uniref:ABC transporter permease n=2 Tax=Loigolactobacillus backii TaxID=375175 RepID=UPI000AF76868|nr:ABC transporter permease [Loigolactobacillus backii]
MMTKILALTTNLFRKKSNSVHAIVGLQLLALVITLINMLWKHTFDRIDPIGLTLSYGFLAGLILFILLARRTEHVWTSSSARLLPITDTKLYLANLGSTLLSFIYFLVLELIIGGICSIGALSDIHASFQQILPYTATSLTTILALTLYGWAFISLVHLLGVTISTWLPEMRSKFIYFVLYVVVGILLLKILSTMGNLLGKFVTPLFTGQYNATINPGLLSFSGILFLITIVFSLLNIYLLKNWVETKQNA